MIRIILIRSVCTEFSQCQFPVLDDKNFFFWCGEDIFMWHCYLLISERRRGVRAPLLHLLTSKVSLAQDTPYAKVAYFGAAYSTTPLLSM
jgi:hypothetical protein